MSQIGFMCFTAPVKQAELTMKQKVIALALEQRTNILNHFINRNSAHHASIELGIEEALVGYMYLKYDEIQQRCRAYMKGEVIVTPAVTHEDKDGKIIVDKEAVMNTVPSDAATLRTTVAGEFVDDFPGATINEVTAAMIKWSKFDGTGTWAFYSTNIKL